MNLQALYRADHSQMPRAQVVAARQEVNQISAQLDKLTDARLASADEGTPAVFVRRARQLEIELNSAQTPRVQAAELDLAGAARTDIAGSDAAWRALAAGIEAQEIEPRLQARRWWQTRLNASWCTHAGSIPPPGPPNATTKLT